ncbi:gluconate 2-dehydrogenase subunit 3 family protein [uncultured Arcticibacterium sp.]|uniref:gluconate 2-dehydrogenase subunit 3 family protein n=1 Tax=uncultured Arcticibacterium sp. TaxID=2173042 RepID=UPI0030F5CB49
MQRREALKQTALFGISTALFPSLLQSCKEQSRLNWQPQFLSVKHAELISSLVDTLLPKTETPGALEMKVDMFIDLVYGKLNGEAGQKEMDKGMDKFDEKCEAEFGDRFADLSQENKVAFLKMEEASSPKFNGSIWGTAAGKQEPVGFYRSLKSTALWGYFSSEEIGLNVLTYDPVPGPYQGCIPLSEVGNTYSL